MTLHFQVLAELVFSVFKHRGNIAITSRQRLHHELPLPLVGRGPGGGGTVPQALSLQQSVCPTTPHPNPSPRGGGAFRLPSFKCYSQLAERRIKRLSSVIPLFLLLAACATTHAPAQQAPADYTPLQPHIAYRQIVTPAPFPRVTQVIELDLSQGSLALRLTRPDTSGGKEFRSLTTSSFTRQTGAILGVNAGFFGPVVDAEGVAMDAAGFVVADGTIASPALVPSQDSAVVRAVVCFEIKRVLIDDVQACPSQYREGLAAGPRLLRDGVIVADAANQTRHPRTALGVSQSGDKVWLVVTDGRQAGYSEGATLSEMADLLRSLGAFNAINLDGGGSSALVYNDPITGLRVLNRPIQSGVPGKERPVATHIGVYRAGN